jgi:uncharacterized protein YceK
VASYGLFKGERSHIRKVVEAGHGECILVFCLSLLLWTAGCGSTIYRLDADPFFSVSPGIYPGVRTDLELMTPASWAPPEAPFRLDRDPHPSGIVILMLDLPLSALCDTLFLPYDLLVSPSEPAQDSKKATPETNQLPTCPLVERQCRIPRPLMTHGPNSASKAIRSPRVTE